MKYRVLIPGGASFFFHKNGLRKPFLFQGMISENYVNQGIVHFWYYVISSITVILVTCVEQGPPVNEIFG